MNADERDGNRTDRSRTLREQWEVHWNHQLRARLDGLTDDAPRCRTSTAN